MGSQSFTDQVFKNRDILEHIFQYLQWGDVTKFSRTCKKFYEILKTIRKEPFPHVNITVGMDRELKNIFHSFPQLVGSVHVTVRGLLARAILAAMRDTLVKPLKAKKIGRIEIAFQPPVDYSIANEEELKDMQSIGDRDLKDVTLHSMAIKVANLSLIRRENQGQDGADPGDHGQPSVTWDIQRVMNAVHPGWGLSFARLSMESDGIQAVSEALRVNQALTKFKLRGNRIEVWPADLWTLPRVKLGHLRIVF